MVAAGACPLSTYYVFVSMPIRDGRKDGMKSGCNVWVDFLGSHTLKARWRDALMSLQVTKLAKKKSCTVPEGPLSTL